VLREATEWPLALAFLAGFTSLLAVRILGHLIAPLFGLMCRRNAYSYTRYRRNVHGRRGGAARALGHSVTGSDAKVYPPMSTQLEAEALRCAKATIRRISNLYPTWSSSAMPCRAAKPGGRTRARPRHSLHLGRAVGGGECSRAPLGAGGGRQHGKTTTSSMLAWILEYANLKPGFLVGGVPENFGVSARLGDEPFFVIEADEYDTRSSTSAPNSCTTGRAPRSQQSRIRPRRHFSGHRRHPPPVHHLVRSVPGSGLLVVNGTDPELTETLKMGCWTPQENFGDESGWQAELLVPDGSRFVCCSRARNRAAWNGS